MFAIYAVKYIDENGYTKSYGYIETLDSYKPGDVITHMGQRIKIDFKMQGGA